MEFYPGILFIKFDIPGIFFSWIIAQKVEGGGFHPLVHLGLKID